MRKALMLVVAGLLAAAQPAAAENEYAGKMKKAFAEMVKPMLADPAVVNAIKEQNVKHMKLTDADIDRLDKQWRAEVKQGGGPLVNDYMARPLSKTLGDKVKSSNGLISELFLMDNKGLNVAQAAPTTDYMQGDEAKWQKTYLVGPNAVFVDEVDFDQSSGKFQSQLSATVVDPANGQAIGAVTVGFDVEKLP